MEISLSQAIDKYKSDFNILKETSDEIFITAKYLDMIYLRLKSDPVGSVILKRIESDIEYEFGLNKQLATEVLSTSIFYIVFKDVVPFSGKYAEIYAENLEEAKKLAEAQYTDFVGEVHSDQNKIVGRILI